MREPFSTRRQVNAAMLGMGAALLSGAAFGQDARPRTQDKSAAPPPDAKPWLTLPAAPALPEADRSGLLPARDGGNFYALYGSGPPVLFLHGGLGSSGWWSHQVRELAGRYTVVVMDTHGHGRSPLTRTRLSYTDFAKDAVALLDLLKIRSLPVVGWSDGAVTGLELAAARPGRISRLFAFAGNSSPSGYKSGGSRSSVFAQYATRCREEYLRLSPEPGNWPRLVERLGLMWWQEPRFTKERLASVHVPTVISCGEYDEIIRREDSGFMARAIPGARLVVQPRVSHFAMLQDPAGFNTELMAFLADA